MPRGVGPCLRVAPDISIWLHALCVALHAIWGEEHTHRRIVVARHVVIQPRHAIGALASEANAGGQCVGTVALVAIGTVELGANDGAGAVEHEGLTTQGIVTEVVERIVDSGGNTSSFRGIVGGGLRYFLNIARFEISST